MIRVMKVNFLMVFCFVLLGMLASTASVIAQEEGLDKANQAKEFYNQGIQATQDGDPEAAIRFYSMAVSLDPDYVDCYLNLGAIHFGRGEFDEALDQFEKAADKAPQNIDALANMGRVRYRLKQNVEAQESFEAALAIDPENGPILMELGKVQYKQRDYEGAIVSLEKGHAAGSGDHASFLYLGKSYQKMGKQDKAIVALQKSIEHKSANYSAHSALGLIYHQQEKFLKAATEYKAALKANPKKGFRASYNYASAMEEANPDDRDQNIANWEAFVKLAKNNPKAKNDVAIAQDH
ncbi:MAG: hypothetical protein DRP45_05100, partial [Candidatus Zixiibacteriota bacterium]